MAPTARARHGRGEAFAFAGVLVVAALAGVWNLRANGLGSLFYASAARSGAASWHNFFFVAFDPQGYTSVDKPPLGVWLPTLSVRIFGYSGLAILLPEVAVGVATVAVVSRTVRRTSGPVAGLLAGLLLAMTPIALTMWRDNDPDALLTLTVAGAAYATVRATAERPLLWLCAAGAFVGLGFETKNIAALLVLPALGLTALLATAGGLGARLARLAAATGVLVVVGLSWIVAVDLVGKSHRPHVGGTVDDTELNLAVGFNGLGRLSGGGGGSFGGPPGLLRFADRQIGPVISWLIPLALLGGVVLLVQRGRAGRTDPTRAAVVLWGTWIVVTVLAFSRAKGIFHPYYTVLVAPGVAALAAIVVVAGVRTGRRSWLPLLIVATAAAQLGLLSYYPHWNPWLFPAVVAAGVLAVALCVVRRVGETAVAVAGALALALAPAAYTLADVTHPVDAGNPVAGAVVAAAARTANTYPIDTGLLAYLTAHRGSERYLVAIDGAENAMTYVARRGEPVLAMGGFSGSEVIPSEQEITRLVAEHQLRYALLTPRVYARPRVVWIRTHCQVVHRSAYESTPNLRRETGRPVLWDCG